MNNKYYIHKFYMYLYNVSLHSVEYLESDDGSSSVARG